MKKDSEILVLVLRKVLEKCNKYSYILKEGESLELFMILPESDEHASIGKHCVDIQCFLFLVPLKIG